MTPQSARTKGQRLEREWSQRLQDAGLDAHARRMPMSGAMQDMKADIITSLPFNFECKNQQTWSPVPYMKQAVAGKKEKEMPVVVMSRNRLPDPYVMMLATDWLRLVTWAKESGHLKTNKELNLEG